MQDLLACCHAAFPAAGLQDPVAAEKLRRSCTEAKRKQLGENANEAAAVRDCQLVVGPGFFNMLAGQYLQSPASAPAASAAAAAEACAAVPCAGGGAVQQWRADGGSLYARVRQGAWEEHVLGRYRATELEEGGRFYRAAWMRTGEAVLRFVNPAMAAAVAELMQRQHARELDAAAPPVPADPADARYKAWADGLVGQSGGGGGGEETAPAGHTHWGNWRCTRGSPCRPHVRCRFHASFPPWVKTAAVLSQFALPSAHPQSWDSTALSHLVVNNKGFSPRLRNLARRFRGSLRNDLMHQDLELDFGAAYALMEELLVELKGDAAGLRAHREQVRGTLTAL